MDEGAILAATSVAASITFCPPCVLPHLGGLFLSKEIVLKVSHIRIDGGTQPRESISHEVVAEYSDALANGAEFPPVVVFYDGADYWLADGFHRLAAHRVANREEIAVDVHQGTRREAILYSVGANDSHGLRRTNADKRRGVMALLNDDEWSQWSDREIARRCAVHKNMVNRLRAELSPAQKASERTYTTKHGTTATMNTQKINANRPRQDLPMWGPEERPKPIVDIGDIPPALFTRATNIGGNMQRLAEMTDFDADESSQGFKQHEIARVVDNARKIIEWLDTLVEALEGRL